MQVTLKGELEALDFVNEAYKHFKAIAGTGEGVDLLCCPHTCQTGEPEQGRRESAFAGCRYCSWSRRSSWECRGGIHCSYFPASTLGSQVVEDTSLSS